MLFIQQKVTKFQRVLRHKNNKLPDSFFFAKKLTIFLKKKLSILRIRCVRYSVKRLLTIRRRINFFFFCENHLFGNNNYDLQRKQETFLS
jgi:hypothetical protein